CIGTVYLCLSAEIAAAYLPAILDCCNIQRRFGCGIGNNSRRRTFKSQAGRQITRSLARHEALCVFALALDLVGGALLFHHGLTLIERSLRLQSLRLG